MIAICPAIIARSTGAPRQRASQPMTVVGWAWRCSESRNGASCATAAGSPSARSRSSASPSAQAEHSRPAPAGCSACRSARSSRSETSFRRSASTAARHRPTLPAAARGGTACSAGARARRSARIAADQPDAEPCGHALALAAGGALARALRDAVAADRARHPREATQTLGAAERAGSDPELAAGPAHVSAIGTVAHRDRQRLPAAPQHWPAWRDAGSATAPAWWADSRAWGRSARPRRPAPPSAARAARSTGWMRSLGVQSRILHSATSTCRFSRSGLPVTIRQTCESDGRIPCSASSATSGLLLKIPRSAISSRSFHSYSSSRSGST